MITLSAAPPPPTRQEPVVEEIHGRTNVDPYRWLEADGSPEVQAWVAAHNAYTRGVLDALPARAVLSRRLAEVLAIGYAGVPSQKKGRYFYLRRDGTQNQPVLYLRRGLDGDEQVILDPNTANAAGTTALDWWYPSDDGRLLAYGYSEHGDEQSTLYVLEIDSGALLPDRIPYTRFSSVEWEPDGSGFYYTRHPAPGSVPPGEEVYHEHVFYHRLGSDPADDPELFGAGRDMSEMLSLNLSPDGRWLIVSASLGWARNELHVCDLHAADSSFQPLVTGLDALFGGPIRGNTLYMMTDWEAPQYRVLTVDLEHPAQADWRELIPERAGVTLQGMLIVGGAIVLHEAVDVVARLGRYSLDGVSQPAPDLPPLGDLTAASGEWDGEDVFLGFESYTVPPTVYRYHLPAGTLSTWAAVRAPVDLAAIQVEQVQYRSKDGTAIPMFVVARRGLPRDGNNPTVLGGYGGFNVSRPPAFTRSILPWLEQGGIYAVANLRGGGEYGEAWHRAGMLDRKQNVFDDFIAAAEYLIAAGYTRPARLAIMGGSNGGLLVGAALTQRPELFQAVVCAVPLLDMLRYHHFRIARLWIPEYGSAEDPQQAAWLWAYSPYQRVTPGTDYPAVLLTSGESDSRVDPMHARKMTALLQSLAPRRPVLLRVETEAGHGAGKPLAKQIAEQADIWTFLAWRLGLPDHA